MDKEEIYKVFGKHLQNYIINKYKTMQKAEKMLNYSANLISQFIHGHKPPSKKFKRIIVKDGFDQSYFTRLEGYEEISGEGLTWDELKFLYLEMKANYVFTIENLREIIKMQEELIKKLQQGS